MHRGGIAIFRERIMGVYGPSKNKYTFKRTLQCFFFQLWVGAYYLPYENTSAHSWSRMQSFMKERCKCLYMDKNSSCFSLWRVGELARVGYLIVNVGNEWIVFLKREVDVFRRDNNVNNGIMNRPQSARFIKQVSICVKLICL